MADDSKTEKASSKKRNDERKKGNIFKSQDIIVVVSLVGCFYALQFFIPMIYETAHDFLIQYLSYVGEMDTMPHETILYIQNQILFAAVRACLPLLLIAMTLAILATGIQTRFLFTGKNLAPKFSRMNPITGIKNLFSGKNAVELLKNLVKISILIIILFQFLQDRVAEVPQTMDMALENSVQYLLVEVMKLIQKIGMWFVAIAGFDYLYQHWEYERQIKMSKQEVKEEYKQMEGNPEIKGKIRDIQKQRARSRMMQAVPTADVIIRNPTHYAVALKYDQEHYNAPVVIAKGQDELALRIIKIAEENHVQVLENRPLARAIYASSEVNQEISPEFYSTVAEILVYVYQLNHKEFK
ncbi:MAG: flagellar biosynthesis protein FlhB [Hungatella sp.]